MKLFWRIIAVLYTGFKISGVNVPAFSFLFNKPKIKFHETIIENIRGDVSFDMREQKLIEEAAKDMYRFTNGRILFHITFDLTTEDDIVDKNVILKAYSEQEYVQKADEKYDNRVIGLCYFRQNGTKSIHMISDRLTHSDNLFRTTVIHEMGHYLEMGHTKHCSIMHPTNSNVVPYPTYIDAVELASVWKCLPSDLRYFKL